MDFAKAVKEYAEKHVDEAIEYVKANPCEYVDAAEHAVIMMQINIIKEVTGMTWAEINEKMIENVEKQLKTQA